MLRGLMQDAPLLISGILEYAARAHGKREIVSKAVVEPVWRYDWHRCDQRARQAAQALGVLGIATGDGVSSLAWNTPTATSNSSMRRRAWAPYCTPPTRVSAANRSGSTRSARPLRTLRWRARRAGEAEAISR